MALNMAEAKTRITVQTEGQQSISALEGSVRDLSAEVKRFAAAASEGGNAASQMASKAQTAASQTQAVGKSAGLAGHHVQNLAFQLNDVVVGLTSGQKPMTVFMQQGSQIGQIMAQAGLGVGGLVKQIGMMVGGFLVANPVMAGIAAAAALAGGAIKLMADDINENSKVHVSWKNTALGTYDALKSYLGGQLKDAFEAMGINTKDAWETAVKWTKTGANFLIGASTLAVRVIIASFSTIGPAIGDAFYSGVNLAIQAINWLTSKVTSGLNSLISSVNPILSKVGLSVGQIANTQIGQIGNPYAGGMGRFGDAMGKVGRDAFSRDYIGDMAGAVSKFAVDRQLSEDAEKKKAKKSGKDGGKAAGKSFIDAFNEEVSKRWAETYSEFFKQFANAAETRKAMNDNDVADIVAQMSSNTKSRTQAGVDAGTAHFNSFGGGSLRGIQDFADQIGTMGEKAFATWNKALQGTEDALVDFAMTGKLSFKSLTNSIISDLVRIAIQQAIMKPLTSFLGGMFANGGAFSGGHVLANATGNAFSGGQVTAFANGGVVSRPTLFPMARGMGLMGEAGPEAVMPLRRMGNGRLGVEARGGGGSNVTVNVDASGGTSVQGDQGKSGELGKAIASAVQAELVRQKRPGGLLAA